MATPDHPTVYHYHPKTRIFVGTTTATPSISEQGAYVLPQYSTFVPPHSKVPDNQVPQFDETTASWSLIDKKPVQGFVVKPASTKPLSTYAQRRQAEYPSLYEFADAVYWEKMGDVSKMTAYVQKVSDVKNKYPKDFSG